LRLRTFVVTFTQRYYACLIYCVTFTFPSYLYVDYVYRCVYTFGWFSYVGLLPHGLPFCRYAFTFTCPARVTFTFYVWLRCCWRVPFVYVYLVPPLPPFVCCCVSFTFTLVCYVWRCSVTLLRYLRCRLRSLYVVVRFTVTVLCTFDSLLRLVAVPFALPRVLRCSRTVCAFSRLRLHVCGSPHGLLGAHVYFSSTVDSLRLQRLRCLLPACFAPERLVYVRWLLRFVPRTFVRVCRTQHVTGYVCGFTFVGLVDCHVARLLVWLVYVLGCSFNVYVAFTFVVYVRTLDGYHGYVYGLRVRTLLDVGWFRLVGLRSRAFRFTAPYRTHVTVGFWLRLHGLLVVFGCVVYLVALVRCCLPLRVRLRGSHGCRHHVCGALLRFWFAVRATVCCCLRCRGLRFSVCGYVHVLLPPGGLPSVYVVATVWFCFAFVTVLLV